MTEQHAATAFHSCLFSINILVVIRHGIQVHYYIELYEATYVHHDTGQVRSKAYLRSSVLLFALVLYWEADVSLGAFSKILR